jgi:hypothetical protein
LKDGYESFKELNSSGNIPKVIFTVIVRVGLGDFKTANKAAMRIPGKWAFMQSTLYPLD